MTTDRPNPVIDFVRRAVRPPDGGATDGGLLDEFVARREEAAFVELVRRHGPMVFGVCRRVLANRHDAEDAFQATFLVLVRRAESVWPREQVGPWLYGVAYRTALKARVVASRRRLKESQAAAMRPVAADEPPVRDEWRPALLDRELARLPEKFRAAVVLCDLQGLPRRDAARALGLAEGTLSSRLATARGRLARRLARGGVLPAAVLVTLAGDAAAVPPALLSSTAALAVRYAAAVGPIPISVLTLTRGVLTTMWLTQFKMVPVCLLLIGALGVGVAVLPDAARAGGPDDAKKPAVKSPGKDDAKKPAAANPGQKEKKEKGPSVSGPVAAIDAAKGTITITVPKDGAKKETEEKTLALVKDARVLLGDVLTKTVALPEGKIADLTPGTVVHARLSADGKAVVEILAFGPGLHGGVKAVDAVNNTITVMTKSKDGPVETTLQLAKEAKVLLNDGLKKGDPDKEGKLSDLAEHTRVSVRQSVDRKTALEIRVLGDTVHGKLKGVDTGNSTVTVSYKSDSGPVEKTFKLAKDARTEGNLTEGVTVTVQLSVFDKETAVAVRAHENK